MLPLPNVVTTEGRHSLLPVVEPGKLHAGKKVASIKLFSREGVRMKSVGNSHIYLIERNVGSCLSPKFI